MAKYLVRQGTGCCGNGNIFCDKEIIAPGTKLFAKSGCQYYTYTCYNVSHHDDANRCWVLEANADDSYMDGYNVSDEEAIEYYNEKYGKYLPIENLDGLDESQIDELKVETEADVKQKSFSRHKGKYHLRGNTIVSNQY